MPGYDIRLVDDDGSVIETKRARWASCRCAGRPARSCTGTTASSRATTFLGEWTRSGDKYVQDEDGYYVYCGRRDDMLKVGGIYVSPFEVEGALLHAIPTCWKPRSSPGRTRTQLIKPKAFVVLKIGRQGLRRAGARAAGALQAEARALQISALDRVPHRSAEDRDRQDPALQAAGGERTR